MDTKPTTVTREKKEARLKQRAKAIWLYGLSGAGKTTLATALEVRLAGAGFATVLLDGDQVRSGLNRGLGYSEIDRVENLRRSAEVARLFVSAGVIPICAFITPLKAHRTLVREIIGQNDLIMVYLATSYDVCAKRDPKGLYRLAQTGQLRQFTGRDSMFESSSGNEAAFTLDTGAQSESNCLAQLHDFIVPQVRH